MHRQVVVLFVVAMLLALAVSPAAASSPPLGVEIVAPTTIPPEGFPSYGPFTASGPAVDAGLVCPTGQTIDLYVQAAGFQSGVVGNLLVIKQFTCDDGSGSFIVKLQVRTTSTTNWVVLSGTDAYSRLHGVGQLYAEPWANGVIDYYSGQLHIN